MRKFEFKDVDQNSDAWYDLRAGRLTSSKLACVMANFGKGWGDPAKRYAKHIAVEQITGKPIQSTYKNEDMMRGHVDEPIARALYEDDTYCTVTNGGFFYTEFMGCSPDGLVGTDGVIEIKSAEAHIHFDRVRKQTYDSAYRWQLIGNLKFTDSEWIDFVSYCKDFPDGKQLFIKRLYKGNFVKEFEMIDERTQEFIEYVNETKEIILNSDYFNQADAA